MRIPAEVRKYIGFLMTIQARLHAQRGGTRRDWSPSSFIAKKTGRQGGSCPRKAGSLMNHPSAIYPCPPSPRSYTNPKTTSQIPQPTLNSSTREQQNSNLHTAAHPLASCHYLEAIVYITYLSNCHHQVASRGVKLVAAFCASETS